MQKRGNCKKISELSVEALSNNLKKSFFTQSWLYLNIKEIPPATKVMDMSKMETGSIKIFISRLNDFEIAHDTDCYNVQTEERGRRKKNVWRLERQSRVQSLLAFWSAGKCHRLLEVEKGRELSSLSPQSPLFLLQLAPHRLNTAHLEQSTATATKGFIFQVTDSSLQSMGIRLTWLECKRFLNWFSCDIMSS